MQGLVRPRPVLVLNADFRPLSYFPLSLISWQDAVKAVFSDRVQVVELYNEFVRSPSLRMQLPSVIALKEFIPLKRQPAFTRFNLFLRDSFTCQYDGKIYPAKDLPFDHVIPRAKGGITSWDNVVTACQKCNLRKGSKLLHEIDMRLLKEARRPSAYELMQYGRAFPPNYLHETWADYLYWDVELEES